jgi:hypothetical protein
MEIDPHGCMWFEWNACAIRFSRQFKTLVDASRVGPRLVSFFF